MPKVKYRRLTEDEEKFIKRYAAGHSREEITNALNKNLEFRGEIHGRHKGDN